MERVRVWEEEVLIPTYEVGAPDRNPMFLEKRVYQGSCGKVYPYPTTETISSEKKDKAYQAVWMENEYIRVMVLPELGGRIQRAYDKTNGYDFVYYNQVIKPALVGLTGPWISGGIEFNWPQHHRPTTFMPVDHLIQEHEDGSMTLLLHDVDQMYGTKGIAALTLYPGKAYIEIRGQLYNRTSMPQTFLWWANPAVSVNDHTQSVFPPDVHSVMDHGKRDVSRFPIATGVYYKHDYSEGVDISRYKNIPVPTSYMAEKSDYDFVGGYDYGKEAGILHVADHHISPGKKQWTWGCGEFGQAWDRNLTDEDGPYIELMTGVFTDNQPDFSWLKPFEEKNFKQYFMPYKKIGYVKNATTDAMVNLEAKDGKVRVRAYATGREAEAVITVTCKGEVIFRKEQMLSPVDLCDETFPAEYAQESDLRVEVTAGGRSLVAYQPVDQGIPELAEPALPAKDPDRIMTNEELYLTGLHIEQYRHATYLPDPYYLEGLKRDPGDIRINNAYGALLMRRGSLKEAEGYFRKALERLTWKNPNPYDSEPYYNLGLTLFYQERYDEAFDAFYKACWSNEQQEMSFYYLAAIAARRRDYVQALSLVEQGLVKNAHNIKARGLKALILARLSRKEQALSWIEENLRVDPFDYQSMYLKYLLTKEESVLQHMNELMRGFADHYLMTARDLAESGSYEEAGTLLLQCPEEKPLKYYYLAFYAGKTGDEAKELSYDMKAEQASFLYCFPNKLEDMIVLERAIAVSDGAKAPYYLGCLMYDKLRFEYAISLWERSAQADGTFPTVWRNLALGYFNKRGNVVGAREVLEKAFALDETDARVFLELDQLYKKLNVEPAERLAHYEAHPQLKECRDDVMIEYVTLLNSTGRYQQALDTIMGHTFRPWEGAEGKVTTQYKTALCEMAKQKLAVADYEGAGTLLEQALVYPENLGEGRLEGTKDNNINYYLGLVHEALGDPAEAKRYYALATIGDNEPAGMMYYYDQPADMIFYQGLAWEKLGETRAANACFYKLIDYGEKHIREHMRIDYFAVSLPDFLIFEDDLDKKNVAHCYYLMGLGKLGLGRSEEAAADLAEVLARDKSHENAIIYGHMAG